MNHIIISFTEKGSQLNRELNQCFSDAGMQSEGYAVQRFAAQYHLRTLPEKISSWIGAYWGETAFLFIGAAGIAVRYIAPWVKDKFTDSAVLVLDENGTYVIPILSGHMGGGVELAGRISDWIGAVPVVTTATDVQGKFAVDVFAKKNGLEINNRQLAKAISAALLDGKVIGVYSELPLEEKVPQGICVCKEYEELNQYEYGIVITEEKKAGKQRMPEKTLCRQILFLRSKPQVVVGIGCRRGTKKEVLQDGLEQVIASLGLSEAQVEAIVSIDLKKEEEGLLALVQEYGSSFYTFSAEELNTVEHVSCHSDFVKKTTGVDNVCERAVQFYCPHGALIQPKCTINGVTFSVLLKPKTLTWSR